MLSLLRRLWKKSPESIRLAVTRTGLPYAANFIVRYRELHHIDNFAGNIKEAKRTYGQTDPQVGTLVTQRFNSIINCLVMPNGVTKTTYATRLTPILSTVISSIAISKSNIAILDLPASTGITSLASLELLNGRYGVSKYVLGDLYHRVILDTQRNCIYDEEHNLLQVAFKRYYFGIHRRHASGNEYTFLSKLILFPHTIVGWFLQRRYRYDAANNHEQLLIVHPEVEAQLGSGIFCLEKMNIFAPIAGSYDVILSFNLLQKNYFPPEVIQTGMSNLAAALNDGGILIVGNTENYIASQKSGGSLVMRLQHGEF